ncbi:nucleotidyl transferase AbiEii/AbiGii toxin family protein [Nocardia alni]|uniref:nucleotidyl transferase AbiEii/AbiGii toxin family protein n=1 Tax=Nocardia alni TaxID=2815723 RepID=UPI001C23F820|nr:nucleotidyl transferase AbiEii/AbiGii toxin family protein [Nocardia alni]
MTYQSAQALRTALERRLLARSTETRTSLDRLRRRVMFERIIARIQAAEPGQWVLKGGMALEVRLHDGARLTKDIDLGLRDDVNSTVDLHERLIDILTPDRDRDYFIFTANPPERLRDDSGGFPTWRTNVSAQLADKPFGRIQLDVSPRSHELHATDKLAIPNSLAFADIPAVEVEAVDIHRHAAEKFHGMLRDFGERENSRVRDLVDLNILLEHSLLAPERAAAAVRSVWKERDHTEPPDNLPQLPESWPDRYERLAAGLSIEIPPYLAAVSQVTQLWLNMFPASNPQMK